ncbi:MAG TPA: ATP-binding cassette domain-containing protein [Candidatus Baltobacteraceae bacterium]|jgi:ABC-type branched-subunit amino acid transport system ATPase component
MRNVDVSFGGVHALRSFSISLDAGEIHGLIGPNGAGKTTAINTLCGVVERQGGEIEVGGRPINPRPRRLVEYGIGRTFQKPAIFFDLSALENVLVGAHAQGRTGVINGSLGTNLALKEDRELSTRAVELLRAVGYEQDPSEPAKRLAFGPQRQIEVARTLISEPRILLLDEPTAGLTGAEIARLAAMLRSVRDERGVTILLVEHNVPFVFGLCNTVTAMHEGARIASGTPVEIRVNEAVVESYLGPHHGETVKSAPIEPQAGEVTRILDVRDLTSGYGNTTIIRDASLHVGTGEIVALLGRNGAGKTTLLNTILGDPRPRSGDVVWEGRSIRGLSTDRIVTAGIGLVPQQRAIIARQSVDDNLLLATFGIRLSRAEFAARVDEMMTRFPRLAQRRTSLGGSLSGGERQMLAIAKVLMRRPKLLLLDEPSIGLAPTIVDELASIVAQLRDEGLPVMIAEQNVTWVAPIARRAYLIEGGRIIEEGAPSVLAESEALAERYLGSIQG